MLDFTVITDNAGLFARGTLYTLLVAASTILLSMLAAVPLAVLRESPLKWVRNVVSTYSWIARATPALTVLFVTYYGLPVFGIFLEPVPSAIIGLTLVSTGYNLEIIRAGLRAVPRGQYDAARALGLSPFVMYRRVVFPQAMRIAVPALFSNMTLMIKGSALASLVAVSELTGEAMGLISLTYNSIPILVTVAAIYLLLNTLMTTTQGYIERSMRMPR
jgi:His/Glu/Gln/Arg/opine family amino acid ABC transporter permease subunit